MEDTYKQLSDSENVQAMDRARKGNTFIPLAMHVCAELNRRAEASPELKMPGSDDDWRSYEQKKNLNAGSDKEWWMIGQNCIAPANYNIINEVVMGGVKGGTRNRNRLSTMLRAWYHKEELLHTMESIQMIQSMAFQATTPYETMNLFMSFVKTYENQFAEKPGEDYNAAAVGVNLMHLYALHILIVLPPSGHVWTQRLVRGTRETTRELLSGMPPALLRDRFAVEWGDIDNMKPVKPAGYTQLWPVHSSWLSPNVNLMEVLASHLYPDANVASDRSGNMWCPNLFWTARRPFLELLTNTLSVLKAKYDQATMLQNKIVSGASTAFLTLVTVASKSAAAVADKNDVVEGVHLRGSM